MKQVSLFGTSCLVKFGLNQDLAVRIGEYQVIFGSLQNKGRISKSFSNQLLVCYLQLSLEL